MTNVGDTVRTLRRNPMYLQFGEHPMLRYLEGGDIDLAQLRWVLQQYWHPIHHFSTFLASCIAMSDDLYVRSRVSLILFQELGKGGQRPRTSGSTSRPRNELALPTSVMVWHRRRRPSWSTSIEPPLVLNRARSVRCSRPS